MLSAVRIQPTPAVRCTCASRSRARTIPGRSREYRVQVVDGAIEIDVGPSAQQRPQLVGEQAIGRRELPGEEPVTDAVAQPRIAGNRRRREQQQVRIARLLETRQFPAQGRRTGLDPLRPRLQRRPHRPRGVLVTAVAQQRVGLEEVRARDGVARRAVLGQHVRGAAETRDGVVVLARLEIHMPEIEQRTRLPESFRARQIGRRQRAAQLAAPEVEQRALRLHPRFEAVAQRRGEREPLEDLPGRPVVGRPSLEPVCDLRGQHLLVAGRALAGRLEQAQHRGPVIERLFQLRERQQRLRPVGGELRRLVQHRARCGKRPVRSSATPAW